MTKVYTKQGETIELPDPLPARHFAARAYENLARQYIAAKTDEERAILRGHLRYWTAVLKAWDTREAQ